MFRNQWNVLCTALWIWRKRSCSIWNNRDGNLSKKLLYNVEPIVKSLRRRRRREIERFKMKSECVADDEDDDQNTKYLLSVARAQQTSFEKWKEWARILCHQINRRLTPLCYASYGLKIQSIAYTHLPVRHGVVEHCRKYIDRGSANWMTRKSRTQLCSENSIKRKP